METQPEKIQKKVIYLTFPPEASGKPLVCDLALNYQLRFSILKAQITPRHEGQMTMEISGGQEALDRGLATSRITGWAWCRRPSASSVTRPSVSTAACARPCAPPGRCASTPRPSSCALKPKSARLRHVHQGLPGPGHGDPARKRRM
jgi:hypothetical protein